MVGQRACKSCRTVHNLTKCPKCGSSEFSTTFKGKIVIINPEESEVAKKLKLREKGVYAIKL